MNLDRLLILERIDDKKDLGTFDPQVFKGGNNLRITVDPQTAMWRFRMEKGLVPGPLRGFYTDFKAAYKHGEQYLAAKGIKIKEVIS